MNRRLMIIFVFGFLIQGCSDSQDEFANQEERLNALTPDNRIIAEDLITFMQTSDDKYFAWVNRINEQAYNDVDNQAITILYTHPKVVSLAHPHLFQTRGCRQNKLRSLQ